MRVFLRACVRAFVRWCMRMSECEYMRAIVRWCGHACVSACERAWTDACVRAWVRGYVRVSERAFVRVFARINVQHGETERHTTARKLIGHFQQLRSFHHFEASKRYQSGRLKSRTFHVQLTTNLCMILCVSQTGAVMWRTTFCGGLA